MGNENRDASNQTRQIAPARERVGLAVSAFNGATVVSNIVAAEAAGVRQIWSTQITGAPDTMSLFAAAAVQTKSVRIGTAIVPTYPIHPLALAQQVLAIHDLAPGRLRLGIGPSHRPTIEGVYGIPMGSPMDHLREYMAVLRPLLWEGKVDYQGQFYKVKAQLPRAPQVPILISALRTGAFHLAGEISDGAISWMCPVPYLLESALPALRAGAAESGRPTPTREGTPYIVAHIPVALSTDRKTLLAAAQKQVGRYGKMPYYANMFADAGFPVLPDGSLPDDLIDNLVVSGDEVSVADRLNQLLASGLDELLVYSVPVADAEAELKRLMHLIGQL